MGLKVYLFKSRNKDNKDIPNFKERTNHILEYDENKEYIYREFNKFVNDGVPGEKCRLYQSVNYRDETKIRKAYLAKVILEGVPLNKLNNALISVAMKKENALTHSWMFDLDTKKSSVVNSFFSEIDKLNILYSITETPNGYAVVIEHGFDTRELLEKFSDVDVTLKRDAMLFVTMGETSNNKL